MKVRVRFSKQGMMKFIGHLDMVRYFQKVNRRANVDVAYSEGFSPHQKMSFAAPLSVGLLSTGEYFDMEVHSSKSTEQMIHEMNVQNVEGVEILSYKQLQDNAKNCMAALAAADYRVYTEIFPEDILQKYMAQQEIIVLKKTKKSEKEVDIRSMIYSLETDEHGVFMQVAQGSATNLKPDLVMKSLYQFLGKELPENLIYERVDMYCYQDNQLVSLDEVGTNI